MEELIHWLLHSLGHAYTHEKAHGDPSRANGWLMVGVGIVLLPIPIFGIPLIIWGIYKLAND